MMGGFLVFILLTKENCLPGMKIDITAKSDYAMEDLMEQSRLVEEQRQEEERRQLEAISSRLMKHLPVFAHRGSSGQALENSFEAWDLAAEQGCPQIELDVWTSTDGTLWVMHDEELERTTDTSGKITQMNDSELQNVKLKNGENIHTFQDVLNRYGNSMKYLVELKSGPDQIEAFLSSMDANPELQNVVFLQTWDLPTLQILHERKPQMFAQLLMGNRDLLDAALSAGYIDSIAIDYNEVDQDLINRTHETDKQIWVWTVNDESDMTRLVQEGVDAIITNYPNEALNAFSEQ